MQKEKQYLVREVCYQIYLSNWMSKKKPMSKDRYWDIDNKTSVTVTDSMKERIKRAKEQYKKEKWQKISHKGIIQEAENKNIMALVKSRSPAPLSRFKGLTGSSQLFKANM